MLGPTVARLIGGLRARPALSAALIYLLLSVLLFAPALLPGKTLSTSDWFWFLPPWESSRPAELERAANFEIADAPAQMQVFALYARERLPDIPLWNPHIVAGRPFLANAQSAVFSPYSLPAYVLPFWTALGWIAVMKVWVAAFGMFLLGRALRMRFGGALLAGVVYAFSLWMVTWVTYPHMAVWSLIPWMLLAADRLVRRPDLLSGAGLAVAVALQFLCGHPESSFHALVVTVLFFALRLVQSRRAEPARSGPLLPPLLAFGGALVAGALLSALTLLPFAELLAGSADLEQRSGASVDEYQVRREFALGIFLYDYWGRPTGTSLELFLLARALYVGALPLMLAAAAIVLRPTAERLWVALFGAISLAVVLGIPPFLQIVTRLPIFSSGHNNRLVVFYVLALALLAGWGLDDLTARAGRLRRRRAVLGIGAGLLLVPVAWAALKADIGELLPGPALDVAWGFATPPGPVLLDPSAPDVIRLASLILWMTTAGAALALLALRLRGRLAVGTFVALAVALVAVDLFRAGMGYNPAIDDRFATQPATPAVDYLRAQRPARFVTATAEVSQNVIPFRHDLYEARGYDLPVVRRFDRLWRREVEPEYPSQVSPFPLAIPLTLLEVRPRALRTLRLLGVTDLMQPPRAEPLRFDGLKLAYEGRDARVYRVHGALPRAFVAGAQHVVDDGEAALDAFTRPGFEGRSVAVTEERLPGVPVTDAAGLGARPAGSARIVSYEPERVVVRARADRQGVLVLGDTYFPGWNATVDGRSAPVTQVDYLFRGVRVGPGTHTVEFRYEPLSWRIGWIISLVSAVGLAVAVAVGRSRARARPARRARREPVYG
jgi:Bacterial membrane protein YfhO